MSDVHTRPTAPPPPLRSPRADSPEGRRAAEIYRTAVERGRRQSSPVPPPHPTPRVVAEPRDAAPPPVVIPLREALGLEAELGREREWNAELDSVASNLRVALAAERMRR